VTTPEAVPTVGLFGGTFDPVHQGHLDLARHVLERCRIDRLLFIPALLPPHKRQPAASFGHRAAMIEEALAHCPDTSDRTQCSRIEEHLPAPSYTINTVQALREEDAHRRYALIIGADTLLDLPHWYRIDTLLELVDLIVVRREGIDATTIDRGLAALAPGFAYDATEKHWLGEGGRTANYLADIELPVSSSAIREELVRGRSPAMLPPPVLTYIRYNRLYGWKGSL
jgi:nicotinate-nucleotide adenylyltransferase